MQRQYRHLVVVDDESKITEIVAEALKKEGFETVRCHGAREFWKAIDDVRPEVLVVDMLMPQQDGVEIVRALGQRKCRTPVVLMSGGAGLYLDAARKLGDANGVAVRGVLRKPFRVMDVRNAIHVALEERGATVTQRSAAQQR